MAICPECKEVIAYLRYWEKVDSSSAFEIDEKGNADYIGSEVTYDNATDLEWCCPECMEQLFTDEKKATKFLKDKDELAELLVEKVNNDTKQL